MRDYAVIDEIVADIKRRMIERLERYTDLEYQTILDVVDQTVKALDLDTMYHATIADSYSLEQAFDETETDAHHEGFLSGLDEAIAITKERREGALYRLMDYRRIHEGFESGEKHLTKIVHFGQ